MIRSDLQIPQTDRKMDSIVEHSYSSSDIPADVYKSESCTPDNLKLPSIRLSQPDEADYLEHHSGKESFPSLSSPRRKGRSPRRSSPGPSTSIFSSTDFDRALKLPILQQAVRCRCSIEPYEYWDGRRTKSAVDCVANLHFLSEEEMAQFDQRLFAMGRRTSFGSGRHKRHAAPTGFRSIRTQTLKRLKSGRISADSLTFHVDHDRERNSFRLPTEKLKKNKKWKVVFTIGKSEKKDKLKEKKS